MRNGTVFYLYSEKNPADMFIMIKNTDRPHERNLSVTILTNA